MHCSRSTHSGWGRLKRLEGERSQPERSEDVGDLAETFAGRQRKCTPELRSLAYDRSEHKPTYTQGRNEFAQKAFARTS